MIIRDKEDNILTVSSSGNVILTLAFDHRGRKLGTLIDGVYTKYDKEEHIFRKLNAWSIPYELYKRSHTVIINTDNNKYTLNIESVDPEILHFKGAGFEKKVYIPLEEWQK